MLSCSGMKTQMGGFSPRWGISLSEREERMDAKLYEAALLGDVESLVRMLEADPLILDRAKIMQGSNRNTILHTSALLGHIEFAKEILGRKPELAGSFDAQGSSPLHLAASKGHLQIVKELLKVDSDVCLSKDKDGRTALDVAAVSGRVEVLRELVQAKPAATRVLTEQGETVFHLCVKHNQLEALKLLVESVDDANVVNMKDFEDNTILHLATAQKHIQMVEYLVGNSSVEVNATNLNGCTPLDILLESPHDKADRELKLILKAAGAISEKGMQLASRVSSGIQIALRRRRKRTKRRKKDHTQWLDDTKSTLMVIAILIATETFEAGLSPPGSAWQDTQVSNETHTGLNRTIASMQYHVAGEAIMGYLYPNVYITFMIFNSLGFLSSLLLILLIISGFPIQRKLLMWILTVTMWIAVSSMIVTYVCSVYALASDEIFTKFSWVTVKNAFLVWLVVIGLLSIGHIYRLCLRRIKNLGGPSKKSIRQASTGESSKKNHDIRLRME